MPKGIMVIIDGMEDCAYNELGGETPYDFGKGAGFKKMEEHAVSGSIRTIPKGLAPDTMVGVLTLLGVEENRIPMGRSYLEAVANNIPISDKDLFLRANFVKLDKNCRVEDSFVVPAKEDINKTKACFEKHNMEYYYLGGYRNIIVVKNGADCLRNILTVPPYLHQNKRFKEVLPSGNNFAAALSEALGEVYEQTAPFGIIPWGQSVYCELPKFPLKAAVVNKTDTVSGIAKLMGMRNIIPTNATGDTDTNLREKAEIALNLLKEYSLVILHIGGTDEATHRGDPKEKAEFISRIDRAVISYLVDSIDENVQMLVTSDHYGFCSTRGHGSEPVRFWLYKENGISEEAGLIKNVSAYELLMR